MPISLAHPSHCPLSSELVEIKDAYGWVAQALALVSAGGGETKTGLIVGTATSAVLLLLYIRRALEVGECHHALRDNSTMSQACVLMLSPIIRLADRHDVPESVGPTFE